MVKLILFLIVSAGTAFASRLTLCAPSRHGFYRFFAFEAIYLLILLNLDYWFVDPFAPVQIVSWVLLLASIALALHGFYLLRIVGKPAGSFENTQQLVTVGAYQYIRHPLYTSLLLVALGAFLKEVSLLGVVLVLITLGCLIATGKVEEAENTRRFGAAYVAYMRKTRMFMPFVL
jgi:protein-S-isoprenylcysteine O-methyltransferase Ste14